MAKVDARRVARGNFSEVVDNIELRRFMLSNDEKDPLDFCSTLGDGASPFSSSSGCCIVDARLELLLNALGIKPKDSLLNS